MKWVERSALIITLCGLIVACHSKPITKSPSAPEPMDFSYERALPSTVLVGDCQDFEKQKIAIPRETCLKEWAVLVYMAADNNLGAYALEDLYEMESGFQSGQYAGSTSKMDVLVELDLPGAGGIDRLQITQQKELYDSKVILSGAFLDIKAGREKIRSPLLKQLDEDYFITQSQRLEDFLSWGVQNYPAKRYAVVIWGHGQGWGAKSRDTGAVTATDEGVGGGVLLDGYPKEDLVDLPQMQSVLKTVRQRYLGGRPFDLLVNDACLMQTAEVLVELKEEAKFIIGSTQIQNFHGLPYRRWFYSMNANHYAGISLNERTRRCGDDRGCWQAMLLPRLVKGTWAERGFQGELDVNGYKQFTISSFESNYVNSDIEPALNELARKLFDFLTVKDLNMERQLAIFRAVDRVPRFEGGVAELGHLASVIEEEVRGWEKTYGKDMSSQLVLGSVKSLQDAILYANVSYHYGADYVLDEGYPLGSGTRVLSVWVPRDAYEYQQRRSEFESQSKLFSDAPFWPKWLAVLFAQ